MRARQDKYRFIFSCLEYDSRKCLDDDSRKEQSQNQSELKVKTFML